MYIVHICFNRIITKTNTVQCHTKTLTSKLMKPCAPVPIKFRSNSNGAFFVAMATLKDVRACILFSLIANRIAKLEILMAAVELYP